MRPPPSGSQPHRLRTTNLGLEKPPHLLHTVRKKLCRVHSCRRGTPVIDSRKTQCPPYTEVEMEQNERGDGCYCWKHRYGDRRMEIRTLRLLRTSWDMEMQQMDCLQM